MYNGLYMDRIFKIQNNVTLGKTGCVCVVVFAVYMHPVINICDRYKYNVS
jgi:hypothetical protein